MDQTFQTSFIPRKPVVEVDNNKSKSFGFFLFFGLFIFFTTIVLYIGMYFYKQTFTKEIANKEASLTEAKDRFEPAKIVELKSLNKRLDAADEILNNHIAISPVFKLLEIITLKKVRYTQFDYNINSEKENLVEIRLSGVAENYRTVALQADLLSRDERVNKYIIDPIFSNLTPDGKGNIVFDLKFTVDKALVNYKNTVERKNSAINDENKESVM